VNALRNQPTKGGIGKKLPGEMANARSDQSGLVAIRLLQSEPPESRLMKQYIDTTNSQLIIFDSTATF